MYAESMRLMGAVAVGALLASGAQGATFQIDDGTAESSLSFPGGGVRLGWMNSFEVTGGNSTITSIEVAFGSPFFSTGLVGGEEFIVYVWSGTPNGVHTLLASTGATVDPSAIGNNMFQTVAIDAAIAGGDGAQFFIGASMFIPSAGPSGVAPIFPVAIDTDSDQNQSWLTASSDFLFDAENLANNDVSPFMFNGFGNFMLRANAVPTPGALSLFGIAGLAAARRRRA